MNTLTFEEIYRAFFGAYSKLYGAVQAISDVDRIDYYNALTRFVSVLENAKSFDDRKRALVDAINEYVEIRDGMTRYLSGARIMRRDPLLSVLCDAFRDKWRNVCCAFGIRLNNADAEILADVIDNTRWFSRKETTC